MPANALNTPPERPVTSQLRKAGRRIGAAMLAALLAGCGITAEYGVTDKKAQQELFFECLEKLPAGPVSAHYNDWAEVVKECRAAAREMMWGCVNNCG